MGGSLESAEGRVLEVGSDDAVPFERRDGLGMFGAEWRKVGPALLKWIDCVGDRIPGEVRALIGWGSQTEGSWGSSVEGEEAAVEILKGLERNREENWHPGSLADVEVGSHLETLVEEEGVVVRY